MGDFTISKGKIFWLDEIPQTKIHLKLSAFDKAKLKKAFLNRLKRKSKLLYSLYKDQLDYRVVNVKSKQYWNDHRGQPDVIVSIVARYKHKKILACTFKETSSGWRLIRGG